tara:strand:+ start:3070 stop:3213 length:144 start_codon:yes stop_codon:yes gene_type:complete
MSRLPRTARTDEILDAARARAKAALKEENPKLTALEKGFYEAYKRNR